MSRVLETKRAQASDHSDELASLPRGHPILSSPRQIFDHFRNVSSPSRKILQLRSVRKILGSKNSRDKLGCEVIDLPCCAVVLLRERKDIGDSCVEKMSLGTG